MHLTRIAAVAGCAALALAGAACSSRTAGSSDTTSTAATQPAAGSGGATAGSAAGGSGAPDASKPYRLLILAPMSGALKTAGTGYSAAALVAVDDINASGGILGRKVVAKVVDDQSQPNQAVTLLQQELSGPERPDAVYAGATSNESLALVPILSREKIVNIGVSSSNVLNDPAKYPYTFRAVPPSKYYAEYLGRTLKAKGYQKISIVASNDALGKSISDDEKAGMTAAGLTVSEATFNSTDLDLTATLSQAKDQNPDAVVSSALLPQTSALILQAREKVGLTAPLYADATMSGDVASLVQPSALKDVSVASYAINFPAAATPALKKLTDAVKAKLDGKVPNYVLAYAYSYDAVKLLQVSAKVAGSTDADKVKAALENLPEQPAGTYLSFPQYKFTTASHFNMAVQDSDFDVKPLGAMVDGQFTPPAGG